MKITLNYKLGWFVYSKHNRLVGPDAEVVKTFGKRRSAVAMSAALVEALLADQIDGSKDSILFRFYHHNVILM
ncbi:hypothetical protein Slin_1296 [Spirosoma linguale DSM 74]|uniref:Uncharacterized protein n=1 Tax=Spirosoma linguale (strain ATCC 33905 / DSM 74 / LMG 10896 / Claus 1) TaxID=504472 RepID=D2QLZ0_SPILD|nr:hypothetical protein Slin_1296 [Spirosoma linguale DSM 74]